MNGRAPTVNLNVTPLRPSASSDVSRSLDEMLRRALRVKDPGDVEELSTALRRVYGAQAARMDQESLGLPVSGGTTMELMTRTEAAGNGDSAGNSTYQRLEGDLRSDLSALIDHPANRLWRPELLGWQSTIMREYAEGANAARLGQDPAQRDRTMLGVKKLGEFARLSRLISLLHPEVLGPYRRLASTLDEAACNLRVLLGQSLYAAGLADGGVILNVPLTDLRLRRDSVVEALRVLVASDPAAAAAGGSEEWGWRYRSYGGLLSALDTAGASYLRIYLREDSLQESLDAMIDGVSSANSAVSSEGLRQIAATVPIEINRLQQLYNIIGPLLTEKNKDGGVASSAALSSFAQALYLFIQSLISIRSGERLVDLGMPYSMTVSQTRGEDIGRERLRSLVRLRGLLGVKTEGYISCSDTRSMDFERHAQLDKILFDLDRAIDLYALGTGQSPGWGDHEKRASIIGKMAATMAGFLPDEQSTDMVALQSILDEVAEQLAMLPGYEVTPEEEKAFLAEQISEETHWQMLVRTLAPRGARDVDGITNACFGLIDPGRIPKKHGTDLEWKIVPFDPPLNPALASTRILEKLVEDKGKDPSKRMSTPQNLGIQPPVFALTNPEDFNRSVGSLLAFLNTGTLALGAVNTVLRSGDTGTEDVRAGDVWRAWQKVLLEGTHDSTPRPLPGFENWTALTAEGKALGPPSGLRTLLHTMLNDFVSWKPAPKELASRIEEWASRLNYCMYVVLASGPPVYGQAMPAAAPAPTNTPAQSGQPPKSKG